MKAAMKDSLQKTVKILNERGSQGLTTLEAMHLGIGRLSARVEEMRHLYGMEVADKWEMTPNGARIKRFFLSQPELFT